MRRRRRASVKPAVPAPVVKERLFYEKVEAGTETTSGSRRLLVADLGTLGQSSEFVRAGRVDVVSDAAFSPDGERLLLAAISNSRPILLETTSLLTAAGADRITLDAVRVMGLEQVRSDRFLACNWSGGYQHPQRGTMMWGLRGGLDDLKVYSGIVDADSFRSAAERGFEFLDRTTGGGTDDQAADQNGRQVASRMPTCGVSHQECPAYHLCVDSQRQMIACRPDDPASCDGHGGRCTLRPRAVEQEYVTPAGIDPLEWVCAADCGNDRQCFTQECQNGPCRFCDPGTLSCVECRDTIRQLGELELDGHEGCPDQRAFRCEAGTCVSDCYREVDDQTAFLCDPVTQYCEKGRCVLHDWHMVGFGSGVVCWGRRYATRSRPRGWVWLEWLHSGH